MMRLMTLPTLCAALRFFHENKRVLGLHEGKNSLFHIDTLYGLWQWIFRFFGFLNLFQDFLIFLKVVRHCQIYDILVLALDKVLLEIKRHAN